MAGKAGTGKAAKPLRAEMPLDDLWTDLRQGARNVAGVTWQVAVSVHLLVLSRAGDLPFVSVTPEGFEDLDCTSADGARTYVQTKETAAGEGRLAAADVGDALKHAEDGARGDQIVLVTDGDLGSGLGFTGWDEFLSGQPAGAVDDVVAALKSRGLDEAASRDVVARSKVVRLPWRLRDLTEQRLAAATGAHPAVAAFAFDRLCAAIAASAADQRGTSLGNARSHVLADVDAAVAAVQSAVDVDGLDAAVAAGVCAPADFLVRSGLTAGQFFAGVDGTPAHIAAGLDVPRPGLVEEVRSASALERYALLVGPSGSGKSVLLWRAARDAVPGARVVMVRRVRTAGDADALVRHVALMRPSQAAPVVVAADNLGRPVMSGWPDAASGLRDTAGVVLIGACRAEDFGPRLVFGQTRLVEPVLDDATAQAIAANVDAAGGPLAMTADEAAARSGGLLMEFLALLTTGARLEQVLAVQADELRRPGRELQRDAARLLTAAHSTGLGLDADRLGEALARDDPSAAGDALAVLRDEHVVVEDGSTWRGLHELRSTTLARLLHESPPPTLAATFARTIGLLDPPEAGWLLRRVAERDPADLPAATAAAALAIGRNGVSAADAAVLLEGAERADNAVYARACLPILESALRPGTTVHQIAMMAYPVRNQGTVFSTTGSPELDGPFAAVEAIGRSLPARPATTAKTVAAGIGPERLRALALAADLPGTVRLLEAGAGLLPVTAALARELLDAHAPDDGPDLWARLVEALHAALPEGERAGALGGVPERAAAVAQADPTAVAVDVDPAGDKAALTVLLPPQAPAGDLLVWDSAPPEGRRDLANDTAVAAARRLASACPELTTVEVVTVTPSGRPFRIGDFEPGHKVMARKDALPDRAGVRRNVGFQSALRRLTAAESWTAALRQQIAVGAELADLVAEAPARLSARDNAGRRRAWTARAAAAVVAVSGLAARPVAPAVDPGVSHARADDDQRRADLTADALADVANALPRLVGEGRPLALAATLREAASRLATASAAAAPSLTRLGSPIPDRLVDGCRRLAGALAALDADPTGARRIRSDDPAGSADRLAAAAAEQAAARQRDVLADRIAAVEGARLSRVEDPTPPSWTIDATAWVVAVPLEQWDDLCEALASIPPGGRADFGGRVVATGCDGTTALITARLAASGDDPLLALPADAARPLVEAAGLVAADVSETPPSRIVDDLVRLSWQTARDRVRPGDWPAVAPDPDLTIDALENRAETACTGLGESGAQDARRGFAVLLNQVASEIAGPTVVTLAGAVYDANDPHARPDDARDLWAAAATVRLASLAAASPASTPGPGDVPTEVDSQGGHDG